MSVDVNLVTDKSGSTVVFHNPAVHPLPQGAGQPISSVKDGSGNNVRTSGQVSGTSVVFNSPA